MFGNRNFLSQNVKTPIIIRFNPQIIVYVKRCKSPIIIRINKIHLVLTVHLRPEGEDESYKNKGKKGENTKKLHGSSR